MTHFLTRRIFPGPVWLHFLMLGGVLYASLAALYPEPKPVLGPPNAARLEVMADSYAKIVGGLPTEVDIERFIDLELRDELLFREALNRRLHLRDPVIDQRILRNMRFLSPDSGLEDSTLVEQGRELNMHLTDEVIRRRLLQVMTQLIIASAELSRPADSAVEAAFEARKETFREPARVSFSHVFLGEVSQGDATTVFERVQADALPPAEAIRLGRAFLSGFHFTNLSWLEVNSRLGREFSAALQALVPDEPLNTWVGPITSVYGQHLVYLASFKPEREQRIDEVADKLRWDLKAEAEKQAMENAVAEWMTGYEVKRS
ncbi:MAG: peptidylprolyl isomerase [Luminiphilus sp.]|nr:peptidylprolyl isomerase [Luminiphilus sp.]